jgi:hypothetical protein
VSRARPVILAAVVIAVVAIIASVAYAAVKNSTTPDSPGAASPSASPAKPTKFRTPDLRAIRTPRRAPAIPAHGAYFGAWVRQGAFTQLNQIAALHTLQGQLGRRLDIVHSYLTWQAVFPRTSDLAALRQGSRLLLSWTGTDSTAVSSGRYDSFIRQRAREIKATRKPIFLEWRWEMDRPNLRSVVGTPAEFIAAWKRVRTIFARQHVSNVAWVWCPTAKGFEPGGDASAYYPGDDEVDWVCADVYPTYGPYRSFYDAAHLFLGWASHHPKPVMIGEFGVPQRYTPGQRSRWLRAAATTVRDDPQVKALVYFDANAFDAAPGNGMAIDFGTSPMGAFQKIADSPYFNPRGLQVPG